MMHAERVLVRGLIVHIHQFIAQQVRNELESLQGSGSLQEMDIVSICDRAIIESGIEGEVALCCSSWMAYALDKGVDIACCEYSEYLPCCRDNSARG